MSSYIRKYKYLVMSVFLLAIGVSALTIDSGTEVEAAYARTAIKSAIESFCHGNNAPNNTAWGFYEWPHLRTVSGSVVPNNATITLPAGATEIEFIYRMETWFCYTRNAQLAIKDFNVMDMKGIASTVSEANEFNVSHGVNRFFPDDASERLVCPTQITIPNNAKDCSGPGGRDASIKTPADKRSQGDSVNPKDYNNHMMSQSPNVKGKLRIPSNWSDGTSRVFCLWYNVKSGAVNASFVRGGPNCILLTLKRERAWSITPTASVNRSTAQPGNTVTFTHRIKNNGPDQTNKTINYGRTSAANNFSATEIAKGATKSGVSTYNVTQADVGKTICRRTHVKPRSSTNNNVLSSGEACFTVPYSFTLAPSVDVSSPVVEPGGQVVVYPEVSNSGPTKSKSAKWQLSKMILPSGTPIPAAGNSGGGGAGTSTNPCSYYEGKSAEDCSSIGSGSGKVFNASQTTSLGVVTYSDTEGLQAGARICFALSVAPYTHNNSSWRNSRPVCVTVGKRPKVQVHGGGLMVGRVFQNEPNLSSGVATATAPFKGDYYGSWSEYGILAPNRIHLMGSAAALDGGSGGSSQSDWSALTFTRLGTENYGGYVSARQQLPRVAEAFPVGSSPYLIGASASLASLPGSLNGRVVTSSAPTINLSGGILGSGKWAVLNAPNSHVTITSDIKYGSGSFSSISQIPQLIIIARNITINSGVNQVDAWLVAKNAVSTCNQKGNATNLTANYTSNSTRLTIEDCKEPLTVNGPVIADKLYLRRTAGSDPPSRAGVGAPAEVFNLRPDAYLWAQKHTSVQGVYQTTSLRELPPRY